jgi:tripartite motif-containing protein 71
MKRFLAVLGVALAALAAHGQDMVGADQPRFNVTPALMFNQHLYYGTFTRPHAVAFDREHNEVWVADSGNGLIGVFGADGAELYSFSSTQFLRDPARLAVGPNGRVLVIEGDRAHIREFNYRGNYKGDLKVEGVDKKPIFGAVAFDGSGSIYVAENRTGQIFVYTADGKLKRQFGSRGGDDGQFLSVDAIAVGADGKTYILDQQALAVQVFDDQGNFLRGWGKHEMGAENVSLPSGIAVDDAGHVFISDELRHQIKIFSTDGKFLGAFGGLGDGPGQLSFPTDLAYDGKGQVYVTERTTSRVQVFAIKSLEH